MNDNGSGVKTNMQHTDIKSSKTNADAVREAHDPKSLVAGPSSECVELEEVLLYKVTSGQNLGS